MIDTTTNITRVGTVLVPVADQDRAVEFYVDTLGFEKRLSADSGGGSRWVEVAPPGGGTTLALVASTAGAAGFEVSFATANAAADHADLVGRGVDADADLIRMGGGVPPMFTFRDPDGNRFRIVERA
ncbi:MAG TPA: VOC family protein [Solirubrobacteraceae bacterium]|nr:VOC family protein [Solirubrobacteraceae bacterium]